MMLTVERARHLFTLDPDGTLHWRINRKGGAKAGDPVGTDNGRGYLRTSVDGRQMLVHRIVWLLSHGYWPTHELDHIDRNTRNNAPANLQKSNRSQNMANRRPMGVSGVTGVHRNGNGWSARRYQTYLGTYRTIEEAGAIAAAFQP
jgi:hypothetical protein